LLKENLNKTLKYNVFIFTIADENIERKLKFIYSQLASFKIKIYVFNIQKSLEKFKMHDRLLYSNYAITESGSGFNLSSKKPINSQILSASVFETYTYKRFQHHLKELKEYVQKLERFEHYNNLFKANTKNAFKVFNEMI
jgi:hypothetical protein